MKKDIYAGQVQVTNYKKGGLDFGDIKEAAKYGAISQDIQRIVWKYMDTPIGKRDGIEMAQEIIRLFRAI